MLLRRFRFVLLLVDLLAAWNSKRLVRQYLRDRGWPKRLERDARLVQLFDDARRASEEELAGVGPLEQPRAEAEIALLLKRGLQGPGVTADDVLSATEFIAPCFEIVDSRISGWDIRIVDTVADNASCGVFVLGRERSDPRRHDLAALEVRVWKNDQPLSRGFGSAVQGSPLASVAWLANTLGGYGVSLDAGEIILSGSLVPLEPARPGDRFHAELAGVGSVNIAFT